MRIVMSKDLKYHFLSLSLAQYGNIDRILELQSYESRGNVDWHRLRSSASLVADEVSEFSPSFAQLAAKTGQYSDGIAVLEDALLGSSGEPGMPGVLVDEQQRRRFVTEKLKHKMPHLPKKSYARELAFVEEFVANITPAPAYLPLPGVLFLSSDPILTSAHLYTLHQVSKEHMLALLALAGIEVQFPAVFIHKDSMAGEVRKACRKELAAFRDQLAEVVEYSYKRLRAGSFKEVYQYANDFAMNDLRARAEAVEKAIHQSDPNVLESVTIGTDEEIPSITSVHFAAGGVKRRLPDIEILRIVSDIITQNLPFAQCHRLLPSMTYAYRLTKRRS
ncbi:MAG: hypothetical protein ABSG19_00190 [Candidatus Aminicenantales bacterium]